MGWNCQYGIENILNLTVRLEIVLVKCLVRMFYSCYTALGQNLPNRHKGGLRIRTSAEGVHLRQRSHADATPSQNQHGACLSSPSNDGDTLREILTRMCLAIKQSTEGKDIHLHKAAKWNSQIKTLASCSAEIVTKAEFSSMERQNNGHVQHAVTSSAKWCRSGA